MLSRILKHTFKSTTISALFLTTTLYSQQYHHDIECSGQIINDQFGNPDQLIIYVVAVHTPLLDGMPQWHEQQQFCGTYTYKINGTSNIALTPTSQKLSIEQPNFDSQLNSAQSSHTSSSNQKISGFYGAMRLVPHQAGVFESMTDKQFFDFLAYCRYCLAVYHMDNCKVERLLSLSGKQFQDALLQNQNLSNRAVVELANQYLQRCHFPWRKKHQDVIAAIHTEVNCREQAQLQKIAKSIAPVLRQEITKQERALQDKKNQDEQKHIQELKKQQHCYPNDLLHITSFASPYQVEREKAFEQTKQEHYKKYEQSHTLDEQTQGFCRTANIDYKQFGQLSGTAMQQQVYAEVADCFKKMAQFGCFYSSIESCSLTSEGLAFAQHAFDATTAEEMVLALALSDFSQLLVNTMHSVIAGITDGIVNMVQPLLHPQETITNMAYNLGFILNFIGQTTMSTDPESIGWSWYAQQFTKEHAYYAPYAEQLIETFQTWIKQSAFPEKIHVATKLTTEYLLTPKVTTLYANVGRTCCSLIASAPELKFLNFFSDLFIEHELAIDVGIVGINSMSNLTQSLAHSKITMIQKNLYRKNTIQSIANLKNEALIDAIDRQAIFTKKGAYDVAHNVNAQDGLIAKLKNLISGQSHAERIKTLSDGRIRYYKKEKLAKNPGPTRGSCYVTEYDPNRGIVRSWQESYDQQGNVNRIHPKTINGKDVRSQHYPPTGKELNAWKNK